MNFRLPCGADFNEFTLPTSKGPDHWRALDSSRVGCVPSPLLRCGARHVKGPEGWVQCSGKHCLRVTGCCEPWRRGDAPIPTRTKRRAAPGEVAGLYGESLHSSAGDSGLSPELLQRTPTRPKAGLPAFRRGWMRFFSFLVGVHRICRVHEGAIEAGLGGPWLSRVLEPPFQ